MASVLRRFDPQAIYLITSRTMQSRAFMAPSDKMNELIGGILARAVHQCGVELFAYVFASDHFHLMVRAPSSIAMSKLMQRLRSSIGVKAGRLAGWSGPFFAGRYRAELVAGEREQLERLAYILSHGVSEGLVSGKWPGLSCVQSFLEGETSSVHRWGNWTQCSKMENGCDAKIDRFSVECPSTHESLTLTPLPGWARLTRAEQGQIVAQLAANIDRARGSHARQRERERAAGRAALAQLRAAAV
jgi:hypothetical protein